MKEYYSNGKLLLTAEYVVLDGAKALAVPTKFGQSLSVTPLAEEKLNWQSYNSNEELWVNHSFPLANFFVSEIPHFQNPVIKKLFEILKEAHCLNPKILAKGGCKAVSKLDFPNNWGLGSSSTLINNIAQWFKIDPFLLLEKTFGGSGYDIACAQNNSPITYKLPKRSIKAVKFNPDFRDEIFFVYLNRKKNSREAIKQYRRITAEIKQESITQIENITEEIIVSRDIFQFEKLINKHEAIISSLLSTPTVKEEKFPDFSRSIKSLGGWGGDFLMATGGKEEKDYFENKSYHTILTYDEMIL